MKAIDETGNRYGKLLVLERAKSKKGKTRWLCECSCGTKKVMNIWDIKTGKTRSCGCLRGKDEMWNRYGNLVVVSITKNGGGRQVKWTCMCDCGNLVDVAGTALRCGHTKSCGCLKMVDETGKRYGRLIVIRKVGYGKNRKSKWLCRCDCGAEVVATIDNLKSGGTKSCGCLRRERTYLGEGVASFNRMISSMKHGASTRGHKWELTDDQVRGLTGKNCHYCDRRPSNRFSTTSNTGDWVYNGLDRVDNTIGYRVDNVVPCCADCNMAKHTRSYDDFVKWIGRVYHNLIGVENAKDDFMSLVVVPNRSSRSRAC